MGRLVFILGGARSGKSDHAKRLAEAGAGPVVFIATAQPHDDEMRRRIAAHRQHRPSSWETIELPTSVSKYMGEHTHRTGMVLLDCLTLLVSNIMLQSAANEGEPDEPLARAAVEQEIVSLLDVVQRSQSDWIAVSNEVGQGLVPAYPNGRLFRDLLGWANQAIARQADEVIWMVAGIPVPITSHQLHKT